MFFKIASAFYLGLASERAKRRFIVLNVSTVNRTLCREQHVARELQVERFCARTFKGRGTQIL
jgi:hypothetical protein